MRLNMSTSAFYAQQYEQAKEKPKSFIERFKVPLLAGGTVATLATLAYLANEAPKNQTDAKVQHHASGLFEALGQKLDVGTIGIHRLGNSALHKMVTVSDQALGKTSVYAQSMLEKVAQEAFIDELEKLAVKDQQRSWVQRWGKPLGQVALGVGLGAGIFGAKKLGKFVASKSTVHFAPIPSNADLKRETSYLAANIDYLKKSNKKIKQILARVKNLEKDIM